MTQAVYAGGTLALMAAGVTLQRLVLSGSYPGDFLVTPGLVGGAAVVRMAGGNFLAGPCPRRAPAPPAAMPSVLPRPAAISGRRATGST